MLLEADTHNRMQDFVEALLRHQGALVEPIEPQGLDVIAPPEVQRALGVGELSRLGFGANLPPMAKRIGMEGDWLDRFAGLLGAQGRWTRRVLSVTAKTPGDPERVLGHELVLDNATYRLLSVTPAWTRYLVMDFRASAISDDKRDFMPRVGVNLATGALPDAILDGAWARDRSPWLRYTRSRWIPPIRDLPAMWDRARVVGLISRALPPRLEAALYPFIKGMRRRLGRDEDRLHRYHNDLYHEATAPSWRRCRKPIRNGSGRSSGPRRSVAIPRETRRSGAPVRHARDRRVDPDAGTRDAGASFRRANTAAQGRSDDLAGLESAGPPPRTPGVRGHARHRTAAPRVRRSTASGRCPPGWDHARVAARRTAAPATGGVSKVRRA